MLYPNIKEKLQELNAATITEARKKELQVLVDYVQAKKDKQEAVNLNFICTHNSRRSQFSQAWAAVAAYEHGIKANCFSGGVEVTAFNEHAVASLQRFGFTVESEKGDNPKYEVAFSDDAAPLIMFSKLYDEAPNPSANFAAIMTCSHADENCPFIPGTENRIAIRYEDPKAFDDTPQEVQMYDARSAQIAAEMLYVFSCIK